MLLQQLFFIDKEEEECSDSEGSEDESEEDSYDEEETLAKTAPSQRLKSQLAKRKKDRASSSDSENE